MEYCCVWGVYLVHILYFSTILMVTVVYSAPLQDAMQSVGLDSTSLEEQARTLGKGEKQCDEREYRDEAVGMLRSCAVLCDEEPTNEECLEQCAEYAACKYGIKIPESIGQLEESSVDVTTTTTTLTSHHHHRATSSPGAEAVVSTSTTRPTLLPQHDATIHTQTTEYAAFKYGIKIPESIGQLEESSVDVTTTATTLTSHHHHRATPSPSAEAVVSTSTTRPTLLPQHDATIHTQTTGDAGDAGDAGDVRADDDKESNMMVIIISVVGTAVLFAAGIIILAVYCFRRKFVRRRKKPKQAAHNGGTKDEPKTCQNMELSQVTAKVTESESFLPENGSNNKQANGLDT